MDPVLEISLESEGVGMSIHLRGVLDRQTGTNVRAVVRELLDDGYRAITINLIPLDRIDAAGFSALVGIQRDVRLSGGLTNWSGWSGLPTGSRELGRVEAPAKPAPIRDRLKT